MTAALLVYSVLAANPALDAGHRSFENLKYEQALTQFSRALTIAETTAERVDAYLYLGMCRFELGDETSGRQAFREALALDRQAALSPLASPKIETAFAEEKARLVVVEPAPVPVPVTQVSETMPPPVAEPAGKSRWPTFVAGAAAIGFITTAIIVGISARAVQRDADSAAFASDAKTLDDRAHTRARTSNILYGAGAAAGVFALTYEFVF